jgi:hypothetical protein
MIEVFQQTAACDEASAMFWRAQAIPSKMCALSDLPLLF